MLNESNSLVSHEYYLKPGFVFVAAESTDISTVLGSCVGVSIYDTKRKTGGMNHFTLPYIQDRKMATACYGNVAIYILLRMIMGEGSKKKDLEAQVFGGAFNPDLTSRDIGHENIMVAKKILSKNRLRIVSEDVGGEKGRKIVFNTSTNNVAVIKVDKLREGDWYPYEISR
jgi:chemotaxis protein CheD